ncbi:hypothetical protein ACG02S_07830 [Roseateles sp. DC23W]|uniref:SGNH hydrolase-type esterase domain-containing protein n=1 Tax=Pelomonas dachongensis TaxID=3299029 RepID=A0ABW7EM94_9BURK
MSDITLTHLAALASAIAGAPVFAPEGDHTLTATVIGSGAVSATLAWQGSNDGVGWVTIATLTPSGTGVGAAQASTTISYRYWRQVVSALTGSQVSAVVSTEPAGQAAAPVSGAGNGDAERSLFMVVDSRFEQSFRPSSSPLGGTTAKGSYIGAADVKTRGITNLYAENPMRARFRESHLLASGDEGTLCSLPSAHPAGTRRYSVTVTAPDEVTFDGIDATSFTPVVSGAAGTDALLCVDQAYANHGPFTHMLRRLGVNFKTVDGVLRPGASTTQLAATISTWPNKRFDEVLWSSGRNNLAYDEAALLAVRDALLARGGTVFIVLPWPDASTGSGWTGALLTRMKQECEFWYRQAIGSKQIVLIDTFADYSDPSRTNEGGDPKYYATEGGGRVHPNFEGGEFTGARVAAEILIARGSPVRRQSVARFDSGNLLLGARFPAIGGTVGGIFASAGASCPANFQVATATRRSGNTNGGHGQLLRDRAKPRADGLAVVAGDLVDINDGNLYLVRDISGGGALGAGVPGGYAAAAAFSYGAAFADGQANLFRIPKVVFDDTRASIWFYFDPRCTTDGGSEWADFFQTIALPAGVAVGDYVRGECEVIQLGGTYKTIASMLTCMSGATAINRAADNLPNIWPTVARPVTLKPEWYPTPKLKVLAGTTHLDFALRVYFGGAAQAVGCPVLVRLPLVEKTTAPGTIG